VLNQWFSIDLIFNLLNNGISGHDDGANLDPTNTLWKIISKI